MESEKVYLGVGEEWLARQGLQVEQVERQSFNKKDDSLTCIRFNPKSELLSLVANFVPRLYSRLSFSIHQDSFVLLLQMK